MKRDKIAIMLLFMFMTPLYALGNGKWYGREDVPPQVPYQRAIILFEDEEQTLILQSKYQSEDVDVQTSFGWVVPIPEKSKVAGMDAESARHAFALLDLRTRPAETRISEKILAILLFMFLISWFFVGIFIIVSIIVLLFYWLSFFFPSHIKRRSRLVKFVCLGLLVCVFWSVVSFKFVSKARAKAGGVEVIDEHSAGIYDVRIVRSERADELIAWLNDNDFRFGVEDIAAFRDYISRDWCFAVAKVRPEEERDGLAVASEGLPDPLILRFPHENPVYPIMLTGTGGHETKVLIYLAAETKMTSGGRLTLRYAGKGVPRIPALHMTEPSGFISYEELSELYLCKFRDTLSPEEMSEDIYFHPTPDMEPYREHIIRW